MKRRTTISYSLLIAVLSLLALSYHISLTKHTNHQTAYNITRAVRGLVRGGDDVRAAVKPSMSWFQAQVVIVTHVVERPLCHRSYAMYVAILDSCAYFIHAGHQLHPHRPVHLRIATKIK